MGVLDGHKVEVFAPDERLQGFQKRLPGRDVTRAGAGFDIGSAFPCPANAFIIPLRRFHRNAHRRDGGIGPQPQIRAEHVTARFGVRQDRRHPARDTDKGGASVMFIGRIKPRVIEEAD